MSRLAARWNAFWYVEGSPLALGMFRFLFAVCSMREIDTSRVKSINAVADGEFHLSYLEFIRPVPESLYALFHDVQYPLLLLLALGLFSRVCCGSLLAIQGYLFFADPLNFRNHPYLFLLVLLLLMLSPAGRAFAVPPVLRAVRDGRSCVSALVGVDRPLTFQRLIQVQICITYFLAGLHKLHPAYLGGDVLRHLVEQRVVLPIDLAPTVVAILAWITVAIELLLPFGLWFRRTRPWCLLLGTAFHLAVACTMDIHVFSYVMIAGYLLFLEPSTLPAYLRRFSGVKS